MREGWKKAMFAFGEGAEERRAQAQTEMLGALKGDEKERIAALQALSDAGEVAFDKEPFAKLVRPMATSAKGHEQVIAFYALHNTVPVPGDLALLHQACEVAGPEMDSAAPRLLFLFGKGDFTSKASDKILLKQLDHPVKKMRIGAIRSLWGAHLTDEAAQKIIDLIHDGDRDFRKDGVYYALSTLNPKNSNVVDYLISELPTQHSNSGRALWGLSYGVQAKDRARVAEAMVELHNSRSSPKTRKRTSDLVREYGTKEQIERLVK